MIGLLVLAEPVIVVLYQRGFFSHQDAIQTASGLRWLAVGTCSIALVRQTVPVFYAMEQTVVPVIMSVVSIAVFVVSALFLQGPFGHTGICMALSLAATAQGAGLLFVLRKRLGRLGIGRTGFSFLRTLFASVLMAPAAAFVVTYGAWEKGGNSVLNISILFLAVIAGVAVFALGAYVLGSPELKELAQAIGKKRSKRMA
jgi:putative peptidoglycan lipid II flippase